MSGEVPKAILYSWPTSVWSTVPRLCLFEKGYSTEEYIVRDVDITKGENFAPSYLKINMNGTVPTLVVPTIETTGSDVDTRFRSLRDTITICDFLDQARGSHSNKTDRPAPALSPATIEGKALSDNIIAIVHLPSVDPNFLQLAARTESELSTKINGAPGRMLNDRKASLEKYLTEAKQAATDASNAGKTAKSGSVTYEQKTVNFLEEKAAANAMLWDVYNTKSGDPKQVQFIEASKKAWAEGVPDALSKLEEVIKGVYTLGDQVSLADFHVIAWLARLVDIAGGKPDAKGYEALEAFTEGKKVGPKVKAFWTAWTERDSFKQAYKGGLH